MQFTEVWYLLLVKSSGFVKLVLLYFLTYQFVTVLFNTGSKLRCRFLYNHLSLTFYLKGKPFSFQLPRKRISAFYISVIGVGHELKLPCKSIPGLWREGYKIVHLETVQWLRERRYARQKEHRVEGIPNQTCVGKRHRDGIRRCNFVKSLEFCLILQAIPYFFLYFSGRTAVIVVQKNEREGTTHVIRQYMANRLS